MKEYRITSANFVMPGESGDPDAHMDPTELQKLKRLAGISSGLLEDYTQLGSDSNVNSTSPVGSNISITATEKRRLERENQIRPGDPEWFRLWFSKPYMTGEKPVGDSPAPKQSKKADN